MFQEFYKGFFNTLLGIEVLDASKHLRFTKKRPTVKLENLEPA